MTEHTSGYSADTAEAVEAYLRELGLELSMLRPTQRDEVIADAAEYFAERLGASATPADVIQAAADLGEPALFAADMRAALGRRFASKAESVAFERHAPERHAPARTMGAGSVLGVPFDVRVPSSRRLAARWWDPMSPNVFVPRVWGLGWDVNFGAVAVKLGLIRPDDEEEALATVPDRVFVATLAIPVVFTLLVLTIALLTHDRTPAQLPAHWDIGGTPDRFWPKNTLLAFDLGLAAVSTAYAVFMVTVRRPRLLRAVSIALATLMSALAAGTYLHSVLWGLGIPASYLFVGVIVLALCLPFAELTVLARIGRAEEWRRDLHPALREEEE